MPSLPAFLCLYQPWTSASIADLSASRVSLVAPAKLDDPFDCLSIRSMNTPSGTTQQLFDAARAAAADPSAFDARYLTGGTPNAQFKSDIQQRKALLQKLKATRLVLLAGNNEVNPLWSQRANGHTGFCLVFDTTKSPFSSAEPVTYAAEFDTRQPLADLDVAQPPTYHAAFLEKADYYS